MNKDGKIKSITIGVTLVTSLVLTLFTVVVVWLPFAFIGGWMGTPTLVVTVIVFAISFWISWRKLNNDERKTNESSPQQ